MTEIAPTRGTALVLAEEQRLIETGYEFLDEKRMLLAAQLLRELEALQCINKDYGQQMAVATKGLKRAILRHGFEGVALYPAPPAAPLDFELGEQNYLGIRLTIEPDIAWRVVPVLMAVDASAEAEECRAAFARLVPLAAKLAARSGNITKLIEEYCNTERRARALENVLLPETKETLAAITDYLDEADQEEAIRIRHAAGKPR